MYFLPEYNYFHSNKNVCCSVTSTVVADAWELPHTAVKVGRVLGRGAFGLVLKGRISHSLLNNRNIRVPKEIETMATEVYVAIKLLQGKIIYI